MYWAVSGSKAFQTVSEDLLTCSTGVDVGFGRSPQGPAGRMMQLLVKLSSLAGALSSKKAAIDRHHVTNRKTRSGTTKPHNG
jgi:hypothetical protein